MVTYSSSTPFTNLVSDLVLVPSPLPAPAKRGSQHCERTLTAKYPVCPFRLNKSFDLVPFLQQRYDSKRPKVYRWCCHEDVLAGGCYCCCVGAV